MTSGPGGIHSREEYRAVLESVADLVVLIDEPGTITYANAAATGVLGVDPDALVGSSLVDHVHDADADAVTSLLETPDHATATAEGDGADADRAGGPFTVEARVRPTDGEAWRWLEFARSDAQPAALDGVVLTARDVTTQKRAVERFEHLVREASDLLVVLDENGVLQYAAPAANRVLGYEPDELVGENIVEHIHPDDRETVVTELRRGVEEPGYTATVEHRFQSKDGEWRWLETRGRGLPDDPALDGRVVVVTRDITDRRNREEQIAAQNERLDRFAAMVSHDLQTPLSIASGNLELYRQTSDEETLERLDGALKRMSELTSDLLRLAREGSDVTAPTSVDLFDCATAALQTSALSADQVHLSESLPTVLGNAARIRSLFENLFLNVADHSGSDPEVWVEPLPDGDGFAVEDDGPGIPADDRESVFELGHSSTDDGTGIGLYIVETVASAHGWDVSVTSGRDGGARFEFRGVEVVSDGDGDGDEDKNENENENGN